MSKLSYRVQGVRGGRPQWVENVALLRAFVDSHDNTIGVDAFCGFGNDYRRRDDSKITIQKDGRCWFSGTFDELIAILSGHQDILTREQLRREKEEQYCEDFKKGEETC